MAIFTNSRRVKPTQYPVVLFHAIRSCQLVSAIIVAGIMSYFLRELALDHYRLPWTFILLLSVSALTIVFLSATILLHCCFGLNPILNTLLNTILFVLWSVSFSLLAWWSSGTLTHVCNVATWESDLGISICRLYKALFSFALFGLVATILALLLDLRVHRSATQRGKFTQLEVLDNKRDAGATGSLPEHNPNPMAAGRQRQRGGESLGYTAPEEQFAYDGDTGYYGAGERRSLDRRL